MLFKFQGLQSQINSYCQFGRLKVRLVATVRSELDCEHCHVTKKRTLLCSHTLKGMLIFFVMEFALVDIVWYIIFDSCT